VSRELPPDAPDEPEPDQRPGRIHTTRPGPLVGFAVAGLVVGWLLRPVAIAFDGTAPTVGWLPVLALYFVAAIMGWVAWTTYLLLHRRRERLEPHRAVNRLVLAKACALAGSMIAGGYFGYALSWLGMVDADLAKQRVTQSLLAGLAAVVIVAASLLLERACRVNDDRE
jgi:MFS family permease